MRKGEMKKRIVLSLLAAGLFCTACKAADVEEVKTIEMEALEEVNSAESMKEDTAEEVTEEAEASEKEQAGKEKTINEELEAIERQAEEYDNQLSENITQSDMNRISGEIYILWDDELNSLWSRFSEAADPEVKETVLAEQREWIAMKEEAVKKAGEGYEGGSMRPLVENTENAYYTRKRCYELAVYLGKAIGQDVKPMEIDYSGSYVDLQGTMEIYSDLEISKQTDGTYATTIELYRLTTLEGTAVTGENGLEFKDDTLDVEGKIEMKDGEGASFIVTHSTWEYLNEGDVFLFPDRL